ncbi:MAG: hypothetical protein AAFQ89_16530 [Cyanobacteria bacterium J06626_18]
MKKGGFSQTQEKTAVTSILSRGNVAAPSAARSPMPAFWRGAPSHPEEFHLRASNSPFARRSERTSPSLQVHHATPLAPLRDQDSEKLEALFEGEQIQDIVLDVHRYIARVYPEPCWEDEPYEFLHGLI